MKVHLIFLSSRRATQVSTEVKPREVIEVEFLPPLNYLSYWKIDGEFWRLRDFTLVTQRDAHDSLVTSHAVATLQLAERPQEKPEKRLKLVE